MRLAPVLIAAVVLQCSGPVSADRWQIQPNVQLQTNYSDNVRFAREDVESGYFFSLDAALRAIRSTESSDTGVYLGLGGTNYPGNSDLNNNRGFAGLDLGYRLERQRFRLDARFDSLSTIYSEVETTGLTQVNRQQNSWRLTPSWTYDLTERSSISLAASYLDVTYDDPGLLPLANYRVGTVTLGGGYRLTERLDLNTAVDYGHYEGGRINNTYDNLGVVVGAEYRRSERSTLSAQVGLRHTEQTIDGPLGREATENSSGYVYALSYLRGFEAGGALRLQARRELAPSGSSEVLDTKSLLVDLSWPLSPRWRVGLRADAYQNQLPNGRDSLSNRTYASLAPRLTYTLSRDWNLSAGYRFRWEEREEVPGDITSNAIFLTLNWTRPWDL